MPEKNHHVYHLVYIALASLVIIAIFLFFWQTYLATYFIPSNSNINANTNTYLQLGYDPLITMVPEDLQSAESKSKIFVSSLDPQLGADTAKVIVILWSSFDNAQAGSVLQNIKNLKNEYGDDEVLLVWKDLVNPENKASAGVLAAIAAHCANEQEEFWEYVDLLYANQNNLTSDNLNLLAGQLGIDITDCLSSQEGLAQISSSYYYAQNQNINTVPTIYVNDQKIDDPNNTSQIKDVINQKLSSYANNE
jgi:protein-disulfide isomerase